MPRRGRRPRRPWPCGSAAADAQVPVSTEVLRHASMEFKKAQIKRAPGTELSHRHAQA